jgi:hypothetical protein
MNPIFNQSVYIIKRQGLSISGKYKIYGAEGKDPILYVDVVNKWIPPSTTFHVYLDEKKKQEILILKDQPEYIAGNMDIFEAETGQKIGAFTLCADTFSEIFKDAWSIHDADDKIIGKFYERKLGKSLARELITHDIPQQLEINIGEVKVGEFRQKLKAIGYELTADFSQDVSGLLDHRLGIAAGIYLAVHQGNEVD